jgi:hypothetical protein
MRNFVQSSHSIITMPKAIRIPVIAASRRPAQRAMRCTFFELISLLSFGYIGLAVGAYCGEQ